MNDHTLNFEQAKKNDKYYTPDNIALHSVQLALRYTSFMKQRYFIEPAAGAGAFTQFLPQRETIAMDIAPEHEGIFKIDFLGWIFQSGLCSHPVEYRIVIGNPPYGKNRKLAIEFIKHAMTFARFICFILPASFRKTDVINALPPELHLCFETSFDSVPFELCGTQSVQNVVFQIWEVRAESRDKIHQPSSHRDFTFVKNIQDADFAFRRVGAEAGKLQPINGQSARDRGFSPSSNHYIKAAAHISPKRLQAIFASLDFSEERQKTVRNPSIGKAALLEIYSAATGSPKTTASRSLPFQLRMLFPTFEEVTLEIEYAEKQQRNVSLAGHATLQGAIPFPA